MRRRRVAAVDHRAGSEGWRIFKGSPVLGVATPSSTGPGTVNRISDGSARPWRRPRRGSFVPRSPRGARQPAGRTTQNIMRAHKMSSCRRGRDRWPQGYKETNVRCPLLAFRSGERLGPSQFPLVGGVGSRKDAPRGIPMAGRGSERAKPGRVRATTWKVKADWRDPGESGSTWVGPASATAHSSRPQVTPPSFTSRVSTRPMIWSSSSRLSDRRVPRREPCSPDRSRVPRT